MTRLFPGPYHDGTLTDEGRVLAYNQVFPQFPKMTFDKGWIMGSWYCGTSFQKAKLYGQHPGNYLKRILAIFSDIPPDKILQACAGTVQGPGITVDLSTKFNPSICTDVQNLPFKDNSFRLVLIDPPYGPEHAEKYGVPMLSRPKTMKEFHRILEVGGYVAWLDTKYPSYSRKKWKLFGLIHVITGFERVYRGVSIFKKLIEMRDPQIIIPGVARKSVQMRLT